ncbi:Exodeoxyribonuclease I subunit C [Candidatus Ruthia magnifica str. Cm (Calyptogena magnifica)]|uniref:Exodeoxyribonuclease I n=2 Tax=Candidatus Ruthturnera TaxID=1541743 RepID=A1AXJ8_RUTMC|nr:exodeoxyribonuclease I [Candidatus Ruthturnera calyptogenae]ABL02655.1 Exodeoxyribonuclease I subunit C [Candidatus Ruthia magnifica str. Cm (Calyptogena magnifica)]
MKTFYWYDYETFGISPKIDRISQFAGIRTDENFNIIDEQMFYCKPTNDCLPSPEACFITGISPQLCEQKGMIEHEFIKKIHAQFSTSNTCIVGYNSIRFDDEFTRHTLYRNFIDPYTWHWQNGNTRWDILNVVRLCYALKKDTSLKWVYDKQGNPVFKLDQLSLANDIEHANAHDALADVHATIAIAKIIKQTQPQLFNYSFSLREKKTVASKISLFEPMLHTTDMHPAQLSCTRLSVALAYHPEYNDRVLMFNLDQDPCVLLELDIEALKTLTFTKQSELSKEVERLQIKELIFNKSPMFVPNIYKLEPKIIKQLNIDMNQCMQHLSFIKDNQLKIGKIVQDLYKNDQKHIALKEVDQSLYDGFIDNTDKRICNQIQALSVHKLKEFHPKFKDEKLSRLFMHFKARNYPNTLTENEKEDWFEIVQGRIQTNQNGYITIDDYLQKINTMRTQHPHQEKLWQQLEAYSKLFF